MRLKSYLVLEIKFLSLTKLRIPCCLCNLFCSSSPYLNFFILSFQKFEINVYLKCRFENFRNSSYFEFIKRYK